MAWINHRYVTMTMTLNMVSPTTKSFSYASFTRNQYSNLMKQTTWTSSTQRDQRPCYAAFTCAHALVLFEFQCKILPCQIPSCLHIDNFVVVTKRGRRNGVSLVNPAASPRRNSGKENQRKKKVYGMSKSTLCEISTKTLYFDTSGAKSAQNPFARRGGLVKVMA